MKQRWNGLRKILDVFRRKPMVEFEFPILDLYADHNPAGYYCTNEEPELCTKLLKGIPIKRGAAIASGGEMAMFCLLPKTQKKLVLVDHSYNSLRSLLMKFALIKQEGQEKLAELIERYPLNNEDLEFLKPKVEAGLKAMPEAVAKAKEPYGSTFQVSYILNHTLRNEWHYGSKIRLGMSMKKLNALMVVHGDVKDIVQFGPYDFFYASNFLQHQNRDKLYPDKQLLNELMPEGGHVLISGNYGHAAEEPLLPNSELIRQCHGYRTSWMYEVHRLNKVTNEKTDEANLHGAG